VSHSNLKRSLPLAVPSLSGSAPWRAGPRVTGTERW
jgi:hypothetical protein